MSDFWKPGGRRAFGMVLIFLGCFGLLILLAIYFDQGCGECRFAQGRAKCIQDEQCHYRDFAEKSKCFYHCQRHWVLYLE